MPASSNNNQQGTDELNDVQQQINKRSDESLESTRRMVGLAAESQEIGTNTIVMLDEQGEKLKRIETGVDNIHVGMNQTDKNLTNLEKCCGLCVLPWNRAPRIRRRPLTNSSTPYSSSEKSSPITTEPKLRMATDEGMPQSGYVTRITNDAREEEMDDNLQLVSSYLGNMKNIALDMNDTIANQNRQIDRIADKSDAGIDRVTAANKRTQNILRNA